MAVWLVRTLDGGDPVPVDETRFSDVDAEQWWAAHVERLAELGAAPVCGAVEGRFCPYASLSRAQMAGVLAHALELDDASAAGFVDTGGSIHESAIDALAAAGITRGCSAIPARFCPDRTLTRAEAASFLNRALAADRRLIWASVGDSYSSGVGADPHGEGSCRRSPRAAGPAAAESLRQQGWPIDDVHLACQGARARDASPRLADGSPGSQWHLYEQVHGPSARADIVVVSVGGNDLGYAPVVLACLPFAAVTEFFTGGCPSEVELRFRVDGFVETLDRLYREIVSKRLRHPRPPPGPATTWADASTTWTPTPRSAKAATRSAAEAPTSATASPMWAATPSAAGIAASTRTTRATPESPRSWKKKYA